MPDLIPFVTRQLDKESVHTVNARDLHAYLGIGRDCPTWVRAQIKRAHLIANTDYIVFPMSGENSPMGRPQLEYHLTFDAAKHVAMMSNSEKGHEVRAWFIAKEKELAAVIAQPAVQNQALQAIIDMAVQLDRTEQRAIQAEATATRAESKADRALDAQQYLTVAEYVYVEKLQRQLPESAYKACSDHLRLYCMDHRIPFRKIPVGGKRWDDEYGYHVSVYAEVFPGWLLRRNGQATLHVLPRNEQEPRDA